MPAILGLIPALILGVVALIWQIVSQVVAVLIRPILNHLNALDPDVPLSPADAADGVQRNRWDVDTGYGQAASAGISSDVFAMMVDIVGEAPGIEQMLTLWNRGLLDEQTLDTMIAYSRVRTEWTPQVKLLAHQTMSSADAIEAALKGVLDEDTAEALYIAAGGLDTQWGTLLATAGNPIGVEQALTLWNHGLITHDQVVQVIRHSRINPTFESIAELMHFKYIPAFQIDAMLKAGAITGATASGWLLAQGYPADQVAGLVAAGSGAKVAKTKTATEAQITEGYDAGLLTHAAASAELVALGYETGEVDFILSLYDYKRKLSMDTAAIGQVRKVFLAHRVDKATASNMLDSLGIDPTARDQYLAIWAIEGEAELHELTAAQVGAMLKKGLMTDADAVGRWTTMGYSDTDAALLLGNYGGPAPAGSPAAVTAAG